MVRDPLSVMPVTSPVKITQVNLKRLGGHPIPRHPLAARRGERTSTPSAFRAWGSPFRPPLHAAVVCRGIGRLLLSNKLSFADPKEIGDLIKIKVSFFQGGVGLQDRGKNSCEADNWYRCPCGGNVVRNFIQPSGWRCPLVRRNKHRDRHRVLGLPIPHIRGVLPFG
jgi:hypothetical protein